MRNYLFILVFFVCLCSCNNNKTDNTTTEIDTIPQLIIQVKKCSRLYSAEIKIHKIVTHQDTKSLKGKFLSSSFDIELPFGERKIAIPIDATVKAYVDLSNISSDNIVRQGNKIELILPDPELMLTATKIEHNNIKSRVPLLRGRFSDAELSNYEKQGRKDIIKDIPNLDIVDLAQASVTKTLVPIFTQLGFKENDITITFRKNLNRNKLAIKVN